MTKQSRILLLLLLLLPSPLAAAWTRVVVVEGVSWRRILDQDDDDDDDDDEWGANATAVSSVSAHARPQLQQDSVEDDLIALYCFCGSFAVCGGVGSLASEQLY